MAHSLVHLAALLLHAPLSPAHLDYRLTADTAAPAGIRVELRMRWAPGPLRLVMAAHPEYDDRYWRYVRDLRVESRGAPLAVVREDSARWSARVVDEGEVVVRYRLVPPPAMTGRGSWRVHLSGNGGLLGGPATFMYPLGAERWTTRATLHLPSGWTTGTGLARTNDSVFTAPHVAELLDGPILVGAVRRWPFVLHGVAHEVAYAPLPGERLPDSTALVGAFARLAGASYDVFGAFPYERFTFLVQQGTSGGLEHGTSVSLGTSAAEPVDGADFWGEAAHEYFHTWNEMRLRPRGWGGLSDRPPARTREKWWMEGVTMYYADEVLRRAGLPVQRATRVAQLSTDIARYLDEPSNSRVSPEEASSWSDDPQGVHGALAPDYYLQGKLIGAMLDLRMRGASGGAKSLDDAMRELYRSTDPRIGYDGADIERAVSRGCACEVHDLFERTVRRAAPIDFDAALGAAGLRARVSRVRAVTDSGRARPDLRLWAFVTPGDSAPRLFVTLAESGWSRAGLRTGDRVRGWNGRALAGMRDIRTAVRALHVGDTVALDVERGGRPLHVALVVGGYDEHRVEIGPVARPTAAQAAVRRGAGY